MSNSSTLLDELPSLSDKDVNILYSIVSLAAESTDPPFRALFTAYDAVLAENRILPDHDQIYFRYLLRLGEGRPTTKNNRDLIARFRRLLAKLDIHIVVGDDDYEANNDIILEGEEEDAYEEDQDALARSKANNARHKKRSSLNLDQPDANHDHHAPRKPRGNNKRRSSFNDSHLEETWISEGRLDFDDLAANGRPALKSRPNGRAQHAPMHSQHQARGRRGARHSDNARTRSLSAQSSVAISRPISRERRVYQARDDTDWPHTNSDLDSLASSEISNTDQSLEAAPMFDPQAQIQIPIEELLFTADAFRHTTIYRTVRRLLHHWHDHTIRQQQFRSDLNQIAINYDSQTLLNQAMSTWRSNLAEKRQAAETDLFFEHLERRATRARDLFLLNKAFTHWTRSASDEVNRTNVARRHILRTRYFNAWRDITAVNELKCRSFGLRKWLPIWRAKYARKAVESERALALHEEKLVERLYWKWFWSFCERRAPVWRDDRTKRSVLFKMNAAAAKFSYLESTAEDMRRHLLVRHALGALGVQGHSITLLEARAMNHRRTSLLSRSFNILRKHSQLAPRWRQYHEDSSKRLAIRSVYTWSLNTTLARRATAADRQRILQNAITNWNDSLRMKVVTTMIEERLKAEAYYKWALAERLALFKRLMDYRLVQRTFQTVNIRFTEIRFRLGEAVAMFHQDRRRRTMAAVMLKLNRRVRNEEHMERQAIEFRNDHVMRDIVPIWHEKHEHVQKLERWSEDARFYCLTHSTIKQWKEATTNAKRNKRRDAYATVRRRIKVSLVQRCFEHWRGRSNIAREMNAQANEKAQVRLFAVGTEAFDRWQEKTQQVAVINTQSEIIHIRRMFLDAVASMSSKGRQILDNREEADNYATQTVDTAIKSEMMKRMKWELFCLKRNNDSASALQIRNSEQHRRNMLRFWADQAMQSKALKAAADPESPSKPEPSMFSSIRLPSAIKSPLKRSSTTGNIPDSSILDSDLDPEEDDIDFGASSTARAEEWTSYDLLRDYGASGLPTLDEESEPPSGSRAVPPPLFATPQPGYLRTPSKRTARQRNRFKALSAQRPASAFAAPPSRTLDFDDVIPRSQASQKRDSSFLVSTTPAPLQPGGVRNMEALTPQVTPFERKMRAGGFGGVPGSNNPTAFNTTATTTPGFRRSRFGRSTLRGAPGTTTRSVRFFDPDGKSGSSGS